MSKKKTIKKPEEITLTKYTEFRFTYIENAQNLSQAVELGGYYAKINKIGEKDKSSEPNPR